MKLTGRSTIRTFVAVAVDCPVPLAKVIKQLDSLGDVVKAVAPRTLHCTLKFLGDTTPETAGQIGVALEHALADAPVFSIHLLGVGAFPHARRPAVVWAGIEPPCPPLSDLQRRAESVAAGMGFDAEARPFHPHVTLARVKHRPPRELQAILEEHATTGFGQVPVTSVELYRSTLGRNGAQHDVLTRVMLRP